MREDCARVFQALLAILLAVPVARAGEIADASLLRDFTTVAFGNEFHREREPRLAKWAQPLRIFVREDVPLAHDERLTFDRHMARLARLTGLAVMPVARESDANYVVIFGRDEDFAGVLIDHAKAIGSPPLPVSHGRLSRTNCAGFFASDMTTGEIKRAAVVIPVERARREKLLHRCIVEETTQTLGLPNDSNAVSPSVFNDSSTLTDLSARDELMLRLLYHRRMRPGLAPSEARAVALEVLPALGR